MLRDRIDLPRLQRDIATYADECARTKRVLRSRWLHPMGDHQKRLVHLRRELTDRHVLLAWARGRLHVRTPPRAIRDARKPDRREGADANTDARIAWAAEAHAGRVAERLAPDYAPMTQSGASA
jgi:hypothetical protein